MLLTILWWLAVAEAVGMGKPVAAVRVVYLQGLHYLYPPARHIL
jgi:hypothetical protein